MRRLRKYVKWKSRFQKMFALVLMFVLCIAVYNIGRWGYYAISYFYHACIKDDANDAFNRSTALNSNYRFYENGGHSYIRDIQTRKKVLKNIYWINTSYFYRIVITYISKIFSVKQIFNKHCNSIFCITNIESRYTITT